MGCGAPLRVALAVLFFWGIFPRIASLSGEAGRGLHPGLISCYPSGVLGRFAVSISMDVRMTVSWVCRCCYRRVALGQYHSGGTVLVSKRDPAMNRIVPITAVGFCLLASFASGWLLERGDSQQKAAKAAVSSSQRKAPELDCEHAPQSDWHTVRALFYEPANTHYNVSWEICEGDPAEQRVRVTDADFKRVFFQFEDDEVGRVEKLDLLGDHIPQLLVLTLSAGTGDDIQWHVICESRGMLQ